MTENLQLNGKTYLPASRAGKYIGVTRDYVGRLCREGKITGRRVGSTWYVEVGSLDELVVAKQYSKAKRASQLSSARLSEYRKQPVDSIAAVPPTVAEIPQLIAGAQQNVRESLRAAGRRVGASATTRAFLEHAPRTVYPTVQAVAQYSNLAHRLLALTFAFALTFGVYGLVDAPYRTVAIESLNTAVRQGNVALAAIPEYAMHSVMISKQIAEDIIALRPNREELLASTAGAAAVTEAEVHYVRALFDSVIEGVSLFTQSLTTFFPPSVSKQRASVTAEIITTPDTATPSITTTYTGSPVIQPIITQPIIERIRESVKTITTSGITPELLAASLQQLDNKLSSQIANVTASGNAIYQVVAQSNRIDQLTGTTLNNITVNGISGLAASDIPALSYFAATSTISIAYGGTGTSTLPTYGKMLIGNSNGTYDLVATSTLGISGGSSQWTTSGLDIYYNTGNVGVGTTSPWGKFSINNSTSDTAGAPLFVVASSTASATTTALIITNAGSLGIATTSPVSKLSVVGESAFAGGGVFGLAYAGKAAPANGLIVQGNVGFGTNQPLNNFVVSDAGAGGLEVNPSLAIDGATGVRFLSYDRLASAYRDFIFAQNGSYTVIGANGNLGIGTTSPTYRLSAEGTSSLGNQAIAGYFNATTTTASIFPYASTTAISATTASTTNLIVSSAGGTAGCATFSTLGVISNTGTACGSGSGGAYSFALTGNATSTLTQFNGGLTAYASSTIGDGTQAGGLTISGGATTTGNAYFAGNVGIGTTSPGTLLSIGNTQGVNFTTGTTTFNATGGIDLKGGGCFAINGTCLPSTDTVVTLNSVYSTTSPGSNVDVVFNGAVDSVASFSAGSGGVLTLPSNTEYYVIEVIGGGGGAGTGGGGGGGGGGYSREKFFGTTAMYYTVGAGGVGSSAAGGTSCFGTNTTACTTPSLSATGGTGGGDGNNGSKGTGGTGSGGDFNYVGGSGDNGSSSTSGGDGGGSGHYGGVGQHADGTDPGAGTARGVSSSGASGGGGAGAVTGSSTTGGAGGFIIYVYTNSVSGADLAENYPVADVSIQPGDIVSFDTGLPITATKAQKDSVLAGVISTKPGLLLSDGNEIGQRPVALSGRVPTKVSLEGGPIVIGDRIAPSSVPGVGKKATLFDDSVGIAIANYDGTQGDTVMVFIDLQLGIDLQGISDGLLEGVGQMATTTEATTTLDTVSSTTPLFVFATHFLRSLAEQLTNWLASAGNGLHDIYATIFHAKEVHTDKLCVGDTCVTQEQFMAMVAASSGAVSTAPPTQSPTDIDNSTSTSTDQGSGTVSDTTPPTIILSGASSVTINVGDTYSDLGATVTDSVNNNLGYTVSLDGATSTTPEQLSLDTSVAGTHIILFSATDQAGNTGIATRTIIVVSSGQVTVDSNPAPATTPVPDTTATSTDPTPSNTSGQAAGGGDTASSTSQTR